MYTYSQFKHTFFLISDEYDENTLSVVVDNEESTMEFIDFVSVEVCRPLFLFE